MFVSWRAKVLRNFISKKKSNLYSDKNITINGFLIGTINKNLLILKNEFVYQCWCYYCYLAISCFFHRQLLILVVMLYNPIDLKVLWFFTRQLEYHKKVQNTLQSCRMNSVQAKHITSIKCVEKWMCKPNINVVQNAKNN